MEKKIKKRRNKGMLPSQKGLNYATFMKLHNVNSCIIPKAKDEDLVAVNMYGHEFLACKYVKSNGNGKSGKENKWYKDLKPKTEYVSIKDHIKIHDGHKNLNNLKPWYYLTKKESKLIQLKHIPKKQTFEDFIEGMTKCKMFNWYKKHPMPINKNKDMKDMFEDQFVEQWKQQEKEAIVRAREFVLSVYDKCKLYGRFKIGQDKYTEGYSVELGTVRKDKVQQKTNTLRKQNSNLVATKIVTKNEEKIILPKDKNGVVLAEYKQAA